MGFDSFEGLDPIAKRGHLDQQRVGVPPPVVEL